MRDPSTFTRGNLENHEGCQTNCTGTSSATESTVELCSYLLILPQLILLASLVALASALPRPDVGDPFLSVSIVRPGQSSVQTDVSRQAVSIRQSGEYVADQVCTLFFKSID